jgi:hypothetical protein
LSREQKVPGNVVNSFTYLCIHDSKLDVFMKIGEAKILKVTALPYKEIVL